MDSKMLYRDRPEWKDVTPIPQNDGPYPVVPIAYSQTFIDTMDYFRAVLLANEMSERAFEVTTDAIGANPGNYTAWEFRRKLLKALNKDLREELEYVQEMAEDNAKNYQLWYHRRAVVEMLGDYSRELSFSGHMLADDAKNYHAWTHRQWVVQSQSLWDGELDYIDELLTEDLRNNSAWNHRWFVVKSTTGFTEEVVAREIDYTLQWIKKAPSNESPWNYLRGAVVGSKGFSSYPQIKAFCVDLVSKGVRSPYMQAVLVEIYAEEAVAGSKDAHTEALRYLEMLENDTDVIRAKYWRYRRTRLETALAGAA
eukprot:comp12682_c0_seq1/m.7774 comp12682_c0_seq1/g.7774  ORF comp12682_c0_seq1/g.7774 comp12682_c0_seq1/m.7774 type:complete len:311 (-) comp12682_c0_seq1:32-964(-)